MSNKDKIINLIKNWINKNIFNIFRQHAPTIHLIDSNTHFQNDAPATSNLSIAVGNEALKPVVPSTTEIKLIPIHIRYAVSRFTFEVAGEDALHVEMMKVAAQYASKEEELLLYGYKNQPGLINDDTVKYTIKEINHDEVIKIMESMKNAFDGTLQNTCWIMSTEVYQAISTNILAINNGKWNEMFWGRPIYICNSLKKDDLCILVDLSQVCFVINEEYNHVDIDTDTALNKDAYIISITIYTGMTVNGKTHLLQKT